MESKIAKIESLFDDVLEAAQKEAADYKKMGHAAKKDTAEILRILTGTLHELVILEERINRACPNTADPEP